MHKLHGEITREFLGLRKRNFQGIVFTRTQIYREIFKSALVYLKLRNNKTCVKREAFLLLYKINYNVFGFHYFEFLF